MRSLDFLIFFAWLAVVGLGCTGTETGNPPLRPTGGVVGFEPMGVAPAISLTDARIGIDGIALFPPGACPSGEPDVALGSPVVANLTGRNAAEPFELAVDPGAFSCVRVTLAPSDVDALGGLSVRLEGTRTMDAVPVLLETADEIPIWLVPEAETFTLEEGEQVLVAIDRTLLETPLGVSTLEVDTSDGVAHVDATRNADRLAAFEEGFAGAVTLRRDANGDGVLDRDEAGAPPLAAAPPTP